MKLTNCIVSLPMLFSPSDTLLLEGLILNHMARLLVVLPTDETPIAQVVQRFQGTDRISPRRQQPHGVTSTGMHTTSCFKRIAPPTFS